jgi:hypothetical protein
MFCLYFLSTHRSDNPENPTSIGRPRKVHLEAFSFIRHLLLIKWETCEIDVQELFWASIDFFAIFQFNFGDS